MAANMDRRTGWYLDRGINPAYVVPLVTAILAGLVWAGGVNSGQQVQDTKIQTIEKKVEASEKNNREDFQKVQDKLDRLIEGQKRMR